jgi:hypothetical protein
LTLSGGAPQGTYLVVGSDGLTLAFDRAESATVRYSACLAAIWWPDGRWLLIGNDGIALSVLPHEWHAAKQVHESITRGVLGDRIVPGVPVAISHQEESPIGTREVAQLYCDACGGLPAAPTVFRSVQGYVVFYRADSESRTLCGECAKSRFRDITDRTLIEGWWGIVPFIRNLEAIRNNHRVWRAVRELAVPTRPDGATSLPAGRPLYARLGVFVSAMAMTVVATLLVALIMLVLVSVFR